ncbi:RNA polymerase sigma factor [Zafaria sp. J156]|uniref:RNA polymerase sigma factor n=1 Tax=Zafaria sp. J156 TaxID=3116490 RepID=UPI002E789D81|nr:sigma-70 family RNA polymerase sigma factor [Zafaria sp. J156]MEE1622294.1 sigma-70 family RNA polymerase sigma factor [Zafaria sp. J156]
MDTHQRFDHLVKAYGPMVLRVCRAVLGPHADAEDAWQETFLSALRAYPGLPADANVEAWLVTIAHRKAIDAVRATARRPVPAEVLPERHSTLGIATDPDEGLWRALAGLPPKQRAAVAYHHVAGLPHREVADILGGTPEAARRACADGVAKLRAALSSNAANSANGSTVVSGASASTEPTESPKGAAR